MRETVAIIGTKNFPRLAMDELNSNALGFKRTVAMKAPNFLTERPLMKRILTVQKLDDRNGINAANFTHRTYTSPDKDGRKPRASLLRIKSRSGKMKRQRQRLLLPENYNEGYLELSQDIF
jgi:hypothetical protein